MANDGEKLKRGQHYPLSDRLTYIEAENIFRLYSPRHLQATGLGLRASNARTTSRERWVRENVKAIWSGEKRPPKQGEWYLSGFEIAAYRAKGDLSIAYHIASIVRLETMIHIVTHEVKLDNGLHD